MKKIKIFIVIISFILSFFIHFIYTTFPSLLTSIISPVNESIWEHMKIILTSTLLASIIEYFIYKKKNIKFNNFLLSIPIVSVLGIVFYLIIYLTINLFISHNFIITIILLFITYIFIQVISYLLLNIKKIKYENICGIVLLIMFYSIFTYLTYNPPKTNLFLDTETNSYGIKKEFKVK